MVFCCVFIFCVAFFLSVHVALIPPASNADPFLPAPSAGFLWRGGATVEGDGGRGFGFGSAVFGWRRSPGLSSSAHSSLSFRNATEHHCCPRLWAFFLCCIFFASVIFYFGDTKNLLILIGPLYFLALWVVGWWILHQEEHSLLFLQCRQCCRCYALPLHPS